MSFKKKLSIVTLVSALFSNSFVNASEQHEEFGQFFESRSVSIGCFDFDEDINEDDLYFIKNPSKPKEKSNKEISNDIFGIKNNFMIKNLNHHERNNVVNIDFIGNHPKTGNYNKIGSSSLDLQNIFGFNKKYLNDLNDIENKSNSSPDKLDLHQNQEKVNSKSESKFGDLLKGLNLSKKQIALSKKIKFGQNLNMGCKYKVWNRCKKVKVYFLVHLPEDSGEIKLNIYYYNVPVKIRDSINAYMQNECNVERFKNHFEKFVFFANDSDTFNSKFTEPLNFNETLTFRTVINGFQDCSTNFFTLKNRGETLHELDYSKYSQDDLVDLCKYFIYCIPDNIIPDSILQ